MKCPVDMKQSILNCVLFNFTLSLLIFCLEYLFIDNNEVFKLPTMTVLLPISSLKSIKLFCVCLSAPILGVYMFTMVISSSWINPFSIMQ